jgi:hypothetical protein
MPGVHGTHQLLSSAADPFIIMPGEQSHVRLWPSFLNCQPAWHLLQMLRVCLVLGSRVLRQVEQARWIIEQRSASLHLSYTGVHSPASHLVTGVPT